MTQLVFLTHSLRPARRLLARAWLCLLLLLLVWTPAHAQGCFPSSFTAQTTTNGLGDNLVRSVFAAGNVVYAATDGGLSISTDGGQSFVNKTTAQGLGDNVILSVFAVGNKVYAATSFGLSISTNGGSSFITKTSADGLGADVVLSVFVVGDTVYAATEGGLSISTDGGQSFVNKTTADGLGDDVVQSVFVAGSKVYAATAFGLSISTDGGQSFVNKTKADGLGDDVVRSVFASGEKVYAATEGGLSISTNGGQSFVNKTTRQGLGDDIVLSVFVVGSAVYAVTEGGLSISTDGGNHFANKAADGLNDAWFSSSTVNSALCPATCEQQPFNALTAVFVEQGRVYVAAEGGLAIGVCTQAQPSDQKTGSVLVFPYYVSKLAERKDTRFMLSNVSAQSVFVHLFFIEGIQCEQADQFVCLTPNASLSFKASEHDPETTGWLLAVAVNAAGQPSQHNGLSGNAFVQDGNYVDNYGAEAFWAHSATPAMRNANGTATLLFDGQGYDGVPSQFAVELQSLMDAPEQKIVTVGLRGDLTQGEVSGAGQVGRGVVYNQNPEMAGCFCEFLRGTCQASATINATTPRVTSGIGTLIPKGQVGMMVVNVGAAVGFLMTPRSAQWRGIRPLHKTAWTVATLTIPVVAPVC